MEIGTLTSLVSLIGELGNVKHMKVAIVENSVILYVMSKEVARYVYAPLKECTSVAEIALNYEVLENFNSLMTWLNDAEATGSLTGQFLVPRFQINEIPFSSCKMKATKLESGFVVVEDTEYAWRNVINGQIKSYLQAQVSGLSVYA